MIKSDYLILIVDDEVHMCDILSRILKKDGYRVRTAPDGKTALRLVEKLNPDLILLDLMMPGIDGREVCSVVRQLSANTQIVYFTAKVESDPVKLKELRNEADAFITKPATSKQILSSVKKLFETTAV